MWRELWLLLGLSAASSTALCPHHDEVEEMRGRKGGFVKRCQPRQNFYVWEVVACLLPSGHRLEFGRQRSEGRYFFSCRKSGDIGGRLHADEIPPPNARNQFVYYTQGFPLPHRHVSPAPDVRRTWYTERFVSTTASPTTSVTPFITTTTAAKLSTVASTTSTSTPPSPATEGLDGDEPTTTVEYYRADAYEASLAASKTSVDSPGRKEATDAEDLLSDENSWLRAKYPSPVLGGLSSTTTPQTRPPTPPLDAILYKTTLVPFHVRQSRWQQSTTERPFQRRPAGEVAWADRPFAAPIKVPGCWMGLKVTKPPYELECHVGADGEVAYRIGACLVAELGDRRLVLGESFVQDHWMWKCEQSEDGKVFLNLELHSHD